MRKIIGSIDNYMVPIMVIACSIIAGIGYIFSANLAYLDEHTRISKPEVLGSMRYFEGEDLIEINDNTGTSYFYKGDATDNYIELNGLMFRIVRYNGDGSMRLVLDEDLLYSSYNSLDYNSSKVKKLLSSWLSSNFGDVKYLVESDYDVTNYVTYETYNLINFDGYLIDYVGLLSVREVAIISDGLSETYLSNTKGMYLGNGSGINGVWCYRNNKLEIVDNKTKLSVRPVINVKIDHLFGKGTKIDPFVIKED